MRCCSITDSCIHDSVTNIHDSIFRATLSQPAPAAGFLRHVLPPDLAAALDWSTLERQNGSFVDEKLVNSHTDLLFSVRFASAPEIDPSLLIYVLFEHWSNPYPAMPVRVLKYEVRIMEHYGDEKTGRYPPVVAVVLCHSKGGEVDGVGLNVAPGASQTGPQPFHDAIIPSPRSMPGLARFVPNFDVWVVDLAEWSDAQLRALSLARAPTVTLWLLRDGRDPDRLAAGFMTWGPELRAVSSTPEGAVVIRYFERVLSPLTWDEFHAKILTINPEAEEIAMSFTQEWFEQGRAEGRAEAMSFTQEWLEQGRAEGRAEGQLLTLAKQLTLKFGEVAQQFQARLAAASRAEIELWTERILRAETIEDVFADR